jgi:hypothetical protein
MEALLEAHTTKLKLPTVKARFRAMATEATREQQTLRPRPTALDSATAARAQPEHFRHHQQPTTTDARWATSSVDGGATASGDTHQGLLDANMLAQMLAGLLGKVDECTGVVGIGDLCTEVADTQSACSRCVVRWCGRSLPLDLQLSTSGPIA